MTIFEGNPNTPNALKTSKRLERKNTGESSLISVLPHSAHRFPKLTPPGVGTAAKAFIKVDKNRIKALAKGCEHCKMVDGAAKVVEEVTGLCVDKTDDGKVCFTQAEWDEKRPLHPQPTPF